MPMYVSLTDANGKQQENEYNLKVKKWMTFYTPGVPQDIVDGWQKSYPEDGSDGHDATPDKPVIQIPAGSTNVIVKCTGVTWGKIELKDNEDQILADQSVHANNTYDRDIYVADGESIHIKHSSG